MKQKKKNPLIRVVGASFQNGLILCNHCFTPEDLRFGWLTVVNSNDPIAEENCARCKLILDQLALWIMIDQDMQDFIQEKEKNERNKSIHSEGLPLESGDSTKTH